jgi:tRNA threonylcarbamoyladenosine biosynthesis protein TsaE
MFISKKQLYTKNTGAIKKSTSNGVKSYLTKSPSKTKKLAEALAKRILKQKRKLKKAIVIGLTGELGSGKTTFLKGFAKGLGIKEKILSPSFIIMKKFSIFNFQFSNFFHIDCYRVEKPKEILDLGFKEIISNPRNIVAIEWAERIAKSLPKDTFWLKFKLISKNSRNIML